LIYNVLGGFFSERGEDIDERYVDGIAAEIDLVKHNEEEKKRWLRYWEETRCKELGMLVAKHYLDIRLRNREETITMDLSRGSKNAIKRALRLIFVP
jgi:hypothetical protein